MPERTLSQRELNRALLARQMLLERARLSLPRALERMCGLQAQYAPSMYIGLWSRIERLRRESVTRALERRTLVQATLMRATIHLVSWRDYWPFEQAVRATRRDWYLRSQRDVPDAQAMAAAARKLRHRLAKGPLRRAQIEQLLGKEEARGVGMWLPMVRVPPSGTWERRRADLYGAAEDGLGAPGLSEDAGIERLVASYLRGFGPATRAEIADFAGLRAKQVDPALERLRLRRFRSEEGEVLLDLPRAPIPAPDAPAAVRFLPTWDATLLVHARRTGILPEEHRSKVFTSKRPQSLGTFLVDGVVAGAWWYADGRVELEPFERIDRTTRRELDAEAARLARFHA